MKLQVRNKWLISWPLEFTTGRNSKLFACIFILFQLLQTHSACYIYVYTYLTLPCNTIVHPNTRSVVCICVCVCAFYLAFLDNQLCYLFATRSPLIKTVSNRKCKHRKSNKTESTRKQISCEKIK